MSLFLPTRVVAIVALAAIVSALTGVTAQAGCGDYITIRNSNSVGMAGHIDLKSNDAPKPCRGPVCSAHRLPESPPMVPPETVIAPASDLALGTLVDFDSASRHARRIPQSSDRSPIHRPSLPFDPPRIES